MRYIAIVCLAGAGLIAAGPLALQAVGASPIRAAPKITTVNAPAAAPQHASAPERAIAITAEEAAEPAPELAGGPEIQLALNAAASDQTPSAPEAEAGEGDAGPAETLAERIRVSLFADSRCPGEQQSLVIIGAATRGWDVGAAGSALRIVGNDNDLCPAVGAAVSVSRDAANQSLRQTSAPNGQPGGGDAPGGGGGPGYQQGG